MRDSRKDEYYFQNYIEYQKHRIEKFTSYLSNDDLERNQRVYNVLTGYKIDLIKAEFSLGASKERIQSLLIETIQIAKGNHNITYDELLTILSLIVILGDACNAYQFLEANIIQIESDRLLYCLKEKIIGNRIVWPEDRALRKEGILLNSVFESTDKEKKLMSYLTSWYENHTEYVWYNSHLNENDTYCGYWSFESAAIVQILGLNEELLCGSIYYPSFCL